MLFKSFALSAMANKLDMSLEDLIKKSGRTKPAAGKQAAGKPGAQKKQQAGKPGAQQAGKSGAQHKGAGARGVVKLAAGQQKKGVQLKAKGGVAKPGAGKVRRAVRSFFRTLQSNCRNFLSNDTYFVASLEL